MGKCKSCDLAVASKDKITCVRKACSALYHLKCVGLTLETARKKTCSWHCSACKAVYCVACNAYSEESERIKCSTCSSLYHHLCVGLTGTNQKLNAEWRCPSCKNELPKLDNTETPVKASSGATDHGFINQPSLEPTDESSLFMEEMKKLFSDFKAEQNAKLDILQHSVSDIKEQNASLQKSVDFISNQYDDLKVKFDLLQKERKENLAYIQTLEDKLENVEKTERATSIEIRNVPLKTGETKSDLVKIVAKTGEALNIPISKADIRDVYRINSKSETSRPIIAEFTSVLMKEDVLQSVKSFNKDNKDNKLNSTHLHLEGPEKPIFISENLTQKMKRLYFLARDFAKTNKIKFCWTAYGKIYMREKEGATLQRINSETDLANLKDHFFSAQLSNIPTNL